MPRRHTWAPEEDAAIRAAYSLSTFPARRNAIRRVAEGKGVAVGSIHGRARKIGCVLLTNGGRIWSEAEQDALKQYAGRFPATRIAKILHRSEQAINIRLSRIKLSGRVQERGYTRGELTEVMGLDERTLRALIQRRPMRTNLVGNFSESEVQLWIWDNLELLELRKFDQEWLKAMLRKVA